MQFYRIELAEQRRLMGIMQHHSKESELENKRVLEEDSSQHDTDKDGTVVEDVDMEDADTDSGREVLGGSDPERRSGVYSILAAASHHQRKRTLSTPAPAAPQQQQQQQQEEQQTPFPYSITAGVEKGAKNRYRHIWPFEHARVRLHQRRSKDNDENESTDYSTSTQDAPLYLPVHFSIASQISHAPTIHTFAAFVPLRKWDPAVWGTHWPFTFLIQL
ncbi:hypothetical protein MPER_04757 [Moniliophthora perniciosa FA553]|nr:hypothetical protein MPER_04757 [Moniliophthora perniciosa FA553]